MTTTLAASARPAAWTEGELFPSGYEKGSRLRHRLLAAVNVGLAVTILARALADIHGWTDWSLAIAAFAAGIWAADLLTALHHFAMDNYFTPHTPVVGHLVREFMFHHVRPDHILGTGLCQNLFEGGRLALPVLAATAWARPPAPAAVGLVSLLSFLCLAVSIHKWAHMAVPPTAVSWLQKLHLFPDARRHARHHRPPFDSDYAIVSGWSNAPLRRLRFFEAVTLVVEGLTGVAARSRTVNAH
jgi:ubiquitin-conjugating enzyme E2 variant